MRHGLLDQCLDFSQGSRRLANQMMQGFQEIVALADDLLQKMK